MQVTLLGMGGGTPQSVTAEAWDAIRDAELVIGAARLLDALPPIKGQRRCAAVRAEEITALLAQKSRACVIFSGDTGFHSGAQQLLLRQRDCRVLPGLSSAQLLAARLYRPWQDWTLCSAHGTDCDPIPPVMRGRPAFFLTGGTHTPATLCAELTAAGLGDVRVTVGENLTYPEETVTETTAAKAAERVFAPLSVLLVEAVPRPNVPAGGVADEDFVRGNVPMTKREVRAAIRSHLEVRRGDTIWDVGAGTGSVSVELALTADEGRVYAVEHDEEALALITENRRRFGAWNLRVVPGTAPEALRELPAPDAVFIGGSKGNLRGIVDAALAMNPNARLCMTAISLETLSTALEVFREMDTEITQIAVSRAKTNLRLLMANNPVFLLAAKRRETT
ncbi:MAG: precorrin-6y C5,15-methyltransferase (decarboxylating) subunit CbiE [Oscillospiraceae bacterium]|nr:precorrin-6y C5,15-methyltransferase (decarboxylating) subunit CbiE [Oscillospiraceae bacterium]